ncbi:MAG TPA: SRPBCC domain-containing protein [Acidimicrobiales bacterium]|nr:SRPBCC domain-containing protein [Acidimicrobiales bacterium]
MAWAAAMMKIRVGGTESVAARFAPTGERSEHLSYRAQFLDITLDRRLVYSYTFELDGRRRWASLVSVELFGSGDGTRLRRTEQYAFLEVTGAAEDDVAHLKGGTELQLNGLLAALRSER